MKRFVAIVLTLIYVPGLVGCSQEKKVVEIEDTM